MSYDIYRRINGPFWDWHYQIRAVSHIPTFDSRHPYGDIATAWTLLGARYKIRQLQKQDKTVRLTHVESWS